MRADLKRFQTLLDDSHFERILPEGIGETYEREEADIRAELVSLLREKDLTSVKLARWEALSSRYRHIYEKTHACWPTDTVDLSFYGAIISHLWNPLTTADPPLALATRIVAQLASWLELTRWKMEAKPWLASFEDRRRVMRACVGDLLDPNWFFEQLMVKFRSSYRRPVHTAISHSKEWHRALTAAVAQARYFWTLARLEEYVIPQLVPSVIDVSSSRMHMGPRLFYLFSDPHVCCDLMKSGRLWDWWQNFNVCSSNAWETAWTAMAARAVKFGWACGTPLFEETALILPRVLTHISRSTLRLPSTGVKHTFTPGDQKVSGDYSSLVLTNMSYKRSVANILIYSLRPSFQDDSMDRLLGIMRLISLSTLSTAPSIREEGATAGFFGVLINAYLKRVGRERSTYARDTAGRYADGSYRLGPAEDRRILQVALPIALRGVMRKDENARASYEDVIIDLCALDPVWALPRLLRKIQPYLESKTEPYPMIIALKLLGRMSRFLVAYCPIALIGLLDLVNISMDPAEPAKSLHVISMYLALVSFLPLMNYGNCDLYGAKVEELYKVLLPVFGYKTKENAAIFESFQSRFPHNNLMAYPVERLDDPIVEEVDEAPMREDLNPLGDLFNDFGYQSPEQIVRMLEHRQLISSRISDWFVRLLDKCLETLARVRSGEVPNEPLGPTIQSLVVCVVVDLEEDCQQMALSRFLDWALQEPRPAVQKLADAVIAGFGTIQSFDPLEELLKRFEPKMLENDSINSNTSASMHLWLSNLLTALIIICEKSVLIKHSRRLARLSWIYMHSNNAKVFKAGLGLASNTISVLMEITPAPYRHSKSTSNEFEGLASWALPRWLKIAWDGSSEAKAAYECPKIEWAIPSDEGHDTAVQFLHSLFIPYLRNLHENPDLKANVDIFKRLMNLNVFASEVELSYRQPNVKILTFEKPKPKEKDRSEDDDEGSKLVQAALFRTCRVLKKCMEAFSFAYPDERPVDSPLLPRVTVKTGSLGTVLLKHGRHFVEGAALEWIGLQLNDHDLGYTVSHSHDWSGDIELPKIMRKLLNLSHVLLMRDWAEETAADFRRNLEWWTTFNIWVNPRAKTSNISLLEDLTQIAFVERLHHSWFLRNHLRRSDLPFEGDRKRLLQYTLAQATYLYAEIRKRGQEGIVHMVRSHRGAKQDMLKYLIRRFDTVAAEARALGPSSAIMGTAETPALEAVEGATPDEDFMLPPPAGTDDGGTEPTEQTGNVDIPTVNLLRASSQGHMINVKRDGKRDEEVESSIDVALLATRDDTEKQKILLHVQQTGILHLVIEPLFLSRLTLDSELVSSLVLAIIDRLAVPLEVETLKSRLILFTRIIIDQRHRVHLRAAGVKLLSELVSRLETDGGVHWRSRLVALSWMVSLLDAEVLETDPSLTRRVASRLATFADSTVHSSLFTTLATCGTAILLKFFLSKRIVPDQTTIEIIQNAVPKFFESMPQVHNQLRKRSTNVDILYELVIDVIRIERTWPPNRVGKFWKGFSIHCCMFAQSVAQFLYRFVGGQVTLETLTRTMPPLWGKWVAHPVTDDEVHAAIAESIAGVLRSSRLWEISHRQELFRLAQPIVAKQLSRSTPDDAAVWYDVGRYCLSDILTPAKPIVRPFGPNIKSFGPNWNSFVDNVLNLVLHGVADDSQFIPPLPLVPQRFSEESETVGSTALEDIRRVRGMAFMLGHLNGLRPDIIDAQIKFLMEPEALRVTHKKLREDLAQAMLGLLSGLVFQRRTWEALGPKDSAAAVAAAERRVLDRYTSLMETSIPQLTRAVELDAKIDSDEGAMGDKRPAEISAVRTILTMVLQANKASLNVSASQYDVKALDLMMACRGHPEEEIKSSAETTCLALAANPNLPLKGEMFVWATLERLEGYYKQVDWFVQMTLVRMMHLFGVEQRVIQLQEDRITNSVRNFLETALENSNSSVTANARVAYQSFMATLTPRQQADSAKRLMDVLGDHREVIKSTDSKRMGALYGLASIIGTALSTKPFWLPEVICKFAQFGTRRNPDVVRTTVEKSLQDFFKFHQKEWEREIKGIFTVEQREILDAHRGTPIYFS